jgi:hypothetical protein
MGRLADTVLMDRLTATWQLSCLPTWPQYCRATPTECLPFLLRNSRTTDSLRPGRRGEFLAHWCRACAACALLGNAGIVDHPGGEGRTGGHLRQDVVADGLEEKLVIPGRYGNDVMQRLMSAPDIVRIETGLGARRAAMGSTLLRSPGKRRPRQ